MKNKKIRTAITKLGGLALLTIALYFLGVFKNKGSCSIGIIVLLLITFIAIIVGLILDKPSEQSNKTPNETKL